MTPDANRPATVDAAQATTMEGRRVGAFDGLRGAAVAMVVAGHAWDNFGRPEYGAGWTDVAFGQAGFGVRLFFVLSGYLITTLLLEERARTGTISLRGFYLRRTLRIAPAFYAYMTVLAVATAVGAINLSAGQWTTSAVYLRNYSGLWLADQFGEQVWFVGHLWTLAMEEQFYLLWPVTFLMVPRRWLRSGVLAAAAAMPAIRVATYALAPSQRGMLTMMFHTGSDPILLGCAAALWRPALWPLMRRAAERLGAGVWLVAAVPMLASPALYQRFGGHYSVTLGVTVDSLCAAALVLWLHDGQRLAGLGAVANWAPLRGLGLISYSLYLWQQVFLNPYNVPWTFPLWGAVPAALAAALFSYFGIESPTLRLKSRIATLETPQRPATPFSPTAVEPSPRVAAGDR